MLLGTHEHNRLARDETPYPLGQVLFLLFFFGSLLFLAERLFIAFSGIPERGISRFHFMDFIFYQLLLPSGPLAPSSHEIRCNPKNSSTQFLEKWNGIGEREMRWKSGAMMGEDDGFQKSPPVANQNLQIQDFQGTLSIPPNMVKWANVRSKQSLEIKGIICIHLNVLTIKCDTYHDT